MCQDVRRRGVVFVSRLVGAPQKVLVIIRGRARSTGPPLELLYLPILVV